MKLVQLTLLLAEFLVSFQVVPASLIPQLSISTSCCGGGLVFVSPFDSTMYDKSYFVDSTLYGKSFNYCNVLLIQLYTASLVTTEMSC